MAKKTNHTEITDFENAAVKEEEVEEEDFDGEDIILEDLIYPDSENVLHSVLNSLNHSIANYHTFSRYRDYLTEESLDTALLKNSMQIHRDFSALILHTKNEIVLQNPSLLEKVEKLLFKGEIDDLEAYTEKLCKSVNEYKDLLHREGYLPEIKSKQDLNL